MTSMTGWDWELLRRLRNPEFTGDPRMLLTTKDMGLSDYVKPTEIKLVDKRTHPTQAETERRERELAKGAKGPSP